MMKEKKPMFLPKWLKNSRSRGGLTLLEAAASFLILGIASVGAIKTFTIGRVGLESEYEYKMAGELLRQKTEYIIGVVHSMMPEDWPSELNYDDLRGEEVVIDYRGQGQRGAAIGNNRDVIGRIHFSAVREYDDPTTPIINPDWYNVHTYIEWIGPIRTAWQDGLAGGRPRGQRERIDFYARVVPTWIQ
ncbi:MAG: hypothetical protein N2450_00905 [bacterium]|nr:hypothetical protein [bacterium]